MSRNRDLSPGGETSRGADRTSYAFSGSSSALTSFRSAVSKHALVGGGVLCLKFFAQRLELFGLADELQARAVARAPASPAPARSARWVPWSDSSFLAPSFCGYRS